MNRLLFIFICLLTPLLISPTFAASADQLLIYMDGSQGNHLKAYGLAYRALSDGVIVEWALNYRGGSFITPDTAAIRRRANLLGVSYSSLRAHERQQLEAKIAQENMFIVRLEKAPKIGVYTPPGKEPWDDAVTLALTYAEIPYQQLWDDQILKGEHDKLDWLHLHHEDFSGQYGKFYSSFKNAPWYIQQVARYNSKAQEYGFKSVQEFKGAVAQKLRKFVARGGFLFAMCSATDTLDIALASYGIDIIEPEIDGTPVSSDFNSHLDYRNLLAFTNFKLISSPFIYEHSDIDVSDYTIPELSKKEDFMLFKFSAKHDPVPTMLVQNHKNRIKGFFGQTTSFNKARIKPNLVILGDIVGGKRAKYIHGKYGKGTFTFYAGHDPEDYSHKVGEAPTNLDLHKNSPGYRLILNNILFPAAHKIKLKT